MGKKNKFDSSSLFRLLVGVGFCYLAVSGVKRAIGSFSTEPLALIISIMMIVVSILFMIIGIVGISSAFRSGRRKKPAKADK